MKPKEIRRREKSLEILWSDSSTTQCDLAKIRKTCSCAICREMKVPLSEEMPHYPRSVYAQGIELVGNYAIEVQWADGHRSIVSFEKLKSYEA